MECNACLYIADDYGDNSVTIKCQLQPGHEGPHQETFERHNKPVLIQWEVDERPQKEKEFEEHRARLAARIQKRRASKRLC